MNKQTFSKIWVLIIFVVFVAGGILAWQHWRIPKEGKVVPDVSYQIADSTVLIDFPRLGVNINLELGWRIFTLGNLPTDVNKEKFWEIFYSTQYGVPWFHVSWAYGKGFIPLAPLPLIHYTLVSPERWREITQTSGEQLGQFGALGMTPTISELLREIDIVVFSKERGQSLEQFMTMADDKKYLDAKRAFDEGRLQSEPQKEEKEFFGKFKNREIISTVSPNVQSMLLSDPTSPVRYNAELFLLFSCVPGDKVVVLSRAPFYSTNINYLELFRSLSQKFKFKENFCE